MQTVRNLLAPSSPQHEQPTMDPSQTTRVSRFLHNVAMTSKLISEAVTRPNLPTLIPTYSIKPPVLPHPPNVLPELEATGAPASVILQESERFSRDCRALRRHTKKALLNVTQNIPDLSLFDKSAANRSVRSIRLLEETYLKTVDQLKDAMLKRTRCVSHEHSPRPTFKQEFTPLLEKYFKDNAFPSSADRAMLAQKTRMTHRQIEVWFQNHRRRARKDGKPLLRRPFDLNPNDYNLDNLHPDISPSPSSRRSRSTSISPPDTIGGDADVVALQSDSNPLNPVASMLRWAAHSPVDFVKSPVPTHAFPTPFSDGDPIPFKPSYATFEWYRKPHSVTSSSRKSPIDMEDFRRAFELKLRIFDKHERTLKRKRSNDIPVGPPGVHHIRFMSTGRSQCGSSSTTDPAKRRFVSNYRPPSHTLSRSRSCSESSSRSSPSSISSTPSVLTTCSALSHTSLPRNSLSHRLDWSNCEFAEWSSLPSLTLKCLPFSIPFSPRV